MISTTEDKDDPEGPIVRSPAIIRTPVQYAGQQQIRVPEQVGTWPMVTIGWVEDPDGMRHYIGNLKQCD